MSETTQRPKVNAMCPHCGKLFPPSQLAHLIPIHAYPQPGSRCPGSEQIPRNSLTDLRPLWKDLQKTPAVEGK
jgi:hypothetical protein